MLMKRFLLAIGASLVLGSPVLATPGTGSGFSGRSGYFFNKVITGKVTNEAGEALGGVTILVKGTRISAVSANDGTYRIDIPSNATTLVFSFVGMETREVALSGNTSFNISLKNAANSLQDVVVVGYGNTKKENLTHAAEVIRAKEIEDLPVSNLGAALQGRVLGLAVSGGTTRPGSRASLTIRNPLSLAKDGGNNEPLYVIDGVIQVSSTGASDNTWFNNLDASEVESITVLKDAAAAIYGARGANGVIIVKTKRGTVGAPRISYSGSYATNDETYRTKMLTAGQFAQYFNIMNGKYGANAAPGVDNFFSPDEVLRFQKTNYDWLQPAWRSAQTMRHALNISGGTEKATFFANVAYYTQNGNLSTLDYKRWNFRAGSDVNVAAGLKAGLQVGGNWGNREKTFNKIGGENDENDYRNLLLAPRYIPMYLDGMAVRLPGTDQLSQYHFYEIQRLNNLAKDQDRNMTINVYTEYEVPFIKGLKARVNYARNFSTGTGSQIGTTYQLYEFNRTGTNQHIYDSAATMRTAATFSNGNRLYYSNNNFESEQLNFNASYAREFGRHSISGLFSVERQEASNGQQDVWKETPLQTTNGQFGTAFGIIDGRTSGNESGSLGYIGRLNYGFADKYLAEFLFRSDASTKFSPDNYWGKFYSGSVGWVISKEKFFNVSWVDFLKLRYAGGLLGKDDTRAWQWRQRFTFQNNGGAFGGNPTNGMTNGMKMEVAPNPNATWSDEWKNNLGVDARFLRGRLSANVEAYYNKATNMLIERTESVPLTVGGSIAAENWGAIDFYGLEVGLGWSDRVGKDFTYSVDLRFASNNNKVNQGNFNAQAGLLPWLPQPGQSTDNGVWGMDYLGMFKTQADIDAYVKQYNVSAVVLGSTTVLAKDLRPGMLYYRDIRGALQADGTFAAPDGIIDANDRIQLVKRASNPYSFGSTIRLGYKGISFDMVIGASFGGWSEVDNATRKKMNNNIARNFQSRPAIWSNIYDAELNPNGVMPNPHWEDISLAPTSAFWRVNALRMRIPNMNLSYSLPKKVASAMRISNARVALTALNPINLFNPFDFKAPEGAYDTFPVLRTFSLGLNLTL